MNKHEAVTAVVNEVRPLRLLLKEALGLNGGLNVPERDEVVEWIQAHHLPRLASAIQAAHDAEGGPVDDPRPAGEQRMDAAFVDNAILEPATAAVALLYEGSVESCTHHAGLDRAWILDAAFGMLQRTMEAHLEHGGGA